MKQSENIGLSMTNEENLGNFEQRRFSQDLQNQNLQAMGARFPIGAKNIKYEEG